MRLAETLLQLVAVSDESVAAVHGKPVLPGLASKSSEMLVCRVRSDWSRSGFPPPLFAAFGAVGIPAAESEVVHGAQSMMRSAADQDLLLPKS